MSKTSGQEDSRRRVEDMTDTEVEEAASFIVDQLGQGVPYAKVICRTREKFNLAG